jgi:predicted secreted Zn-dependent protease
VDDTCQFAQQCERICNVNIVFTGQINLPQWDLTQEDMSNINKDALAEWNRFLNKLKEHEEGHAETMKNFADEVKNSDSLKRKIWSEACSGISQVQSKNRIIQSLNTNELQTIFRQTVQALLFQKLQEQEDQYDSETNHGANQNAVLTTTFRLHE